MKLTIAFGFAVAAPVIFNYEANAEIGTASHYGHGDGVDGHRTASGGGASHQTHW